MTCNNRSFHSKVHRSKFNSTRTGKIQARNVPVNVWMSGHTVLVATLLYTVSATYTVKYPGLNINLNKPANPLLMQYFIQIIHKRRQHDQWNIYYRQCEQTITDLLRCCIPRQTQNNKQFYYYYQECPIYMETTTITWHCNLDSRQQQINKYKICD